MIINNQINNSARALTDLPHISSRSSNQGGSIESIAIPYRMQDNQRGLSFSEQELLDLDSRRNCYGRGETRISEKCFELQYVLNSKDIAEFEQRAELLRDVLLEDKTALSEKEMCILKEIFNASQQIIKQNQETGTLRLLSLASLLESLIENDSYSSEISSIVKTLLKSPVKALRYAALDIIAAGLGIVPLSTDLLEEARTLLKNEEPGYVLDYLESM
jgi:hypothetical protein